MLWDVWNKADYGLLTQPPAREGETRTMSRPWGVAVLRDDGLATHWH